jgi:catechol 2,3-dioxygenase-like lactoylglutathione lyase family enzyme
MADRAVPNLPARDLAATSTFYQGLGFGEAFRNDEWMILRCGDLQLEFFHHPELKPAESWFSCCLRVRDLDALHARFVAAGVPQAPRGFPSIQPVEQEAWGQRGATMLDPEGSLLRLFEDHG